MFGKEQREKVPSYGARGNLHIIIKIRFRSVKKRRYKKEKAAAASLTAMPNSGLHRCG